MMSVHLNSPHYCFLFLFHRSHFPFKATICSGHILLAFGLIMYSMQIGYESLCYKKKKKVNLIWESDVFLQLLTHVTAAQHESLGQMHDALQSIVTLSC